MARKKEKISQKPQNVLKLLLPVLGDGQATPWEAPSPFFLYISLPSVFTPRAIGTAVARYNFAARDMRELSLQEGDVVKIYSRIGGDQGWWKGEANGRVSSLWKGHGPLLPVSFPNCRGGIQLSTRPMPGPVP